MQMLCKKCGASVPDTTYECPFCKATLGEKPPVEEETVAVEETVEETTQDMTADNEEIFDENELKRREQIQKMLDEKQQQLSEIQDRREQKRKKQRRKKIIIVAAICALISVAVGCGAYFISNSTSERPNVQISTPTPEPTVDPNATESPAPTLDPSLSPLPIETVAPDTTSTAPEPALGSGSSDTTAPATSSGSGSSSATNNTTSSASTNKSSTTKSSTTNKTSSTNKSTSTNKTASTTTKVNNTGITKANLSGVVAKGGKVVLDSATGKYVMSFISGNTEYFAYVSEGSTTAQVQNKTLSVTANPSSGTYKGSTVYDITSLTFFDGDYIIKDSSIKLLSEADIKGLTKAQLGYARNEIFARHGRPFKTQKYKDYFAKCSWYKVNPNYNLNDDKSNLNSIERANVDFILAHENK